MPRSPRSVDVPGLAHNAPIPVAARVGPLLCSSAIAGKDPSTGQLPADSGIQVRLAFANMQRVLATAGASPADVAKLSVTLSDDSAREAVNAEWLALFPDPADRPARHVVVHALQHGLALQLEFIALIQKEG
ncbi:RidA family protein [Piscinibacter sp.]|uniref:RidA family protein n=1 Tax=Piscinibacter sp. TaxID=1903157 RepID=UPI002C91B9C7|nr:Rid family hydrolase [Albitalea sp.]HUG21204.1 Rid family hydrolase [Albitalea sp.]